MLPLKYLFHQLELALMLLKNWQYDETSLDFHNKFRISSNAIYPFKSDGKLAFLRFSPEVEKHDHLIHAEIDFIQHLHAHQYSALEPVCSMTNHFVIQQNTPWGLYNACVFRKVEGKQVDSISYNDGLLYSCREALGRLHLVSRNLLPPKQRGWTHTQVFEWVLHILENLPGENIAKRLCQKLHHEISKLPVTKENYGLIHYDFEPDNLFFDEPTQSISVIDFDDCIYHWYVMDIIRSWSEFSEAYPSKVQEEKKNQFLEGYTSVYLIDPLIWNHGELLEQWVSLYMYTCIQHSVEETWNNEPSWMMGLREKLQSKVNFIARKWS